MIEPSHQLSISRQCAMMGVNRSSYYYQSKPIRLEDLELMRQIDEMYLKDPTKGSRGIKRQLKREGQRVNRKRIQRLMRLMGIEAIYPKPHTSRPHPQHRIYPYLLRDLTIDRPNQVWAADISVLQ
jgi:putative transposase